MKFNWLVFGTLGFFLGVFVGSFDFFNFYTELFLSFIIFILIGRFVFENRKKYFIFWFLFVIGLTRIFLANSLFIQNQILPVENEQDFVGITYREPDKRDNKVLLYLKVKVPGRDDKFQKVLVFAPLYPEIKIGDRVFFNGKFVFPKAFVSEGRLFDYPGFLKKEKVSLVMYRPKIKKIEQNGCCLLSQKIIGFKEKFKDNLNKTIRAPESSLLNGILLGDKRSGGPEWLEKFRITGLIHIMVLSGYNISIVSDFILKFFAFLPGNLTLIISVMALLFFIVAVGGSATVLRAGIMAMVAILARFLGRKYNVKNSLFVAGFIMVFWNPFILVFDPAFQLSFLATFALIYLAPYLEVKFSKFYPGRFVIIKSIVAVTITVQLFVTPLLLYMTGNLPIFALPANILVLPLVPTVMALGGLVGFLGFISQVIALPIAFLAQIFLFIILNIVSFIAFITPKIKLPAFPFWVVAGVYLGFFIVWRFNNTRKKRL